MSEPKKHEPTLEEMLLILELRGYKYFPGMDTGFHRKVPTLTRCLGAYGPERDNLDFDPEKGDLCYRKDCEDFATGGWKAPDSEAIPALFKKVVNRP